MNKVKKLYIYFLIITIVFILTGCYAVNINVTTEGKGKVMREVDVSDSQENAILTDLTSSQRSDLNKKNTYPKGSKIIFRAIPEKGWIFSHWIGSIEKTTNPKLHMVADEDYQIKAVFRSLEDVIKNGDIDLIERTISEENVNSYISNYGFLLNVAIENDRNLAIIKTLIKKGANINKETDIPPLYHAFKTGNYEIIKILLENGANPNMRGENGKNALMYAIETANTDIISLVLDFDVNFNLEDEFGNTVWDYIKNNEKLKGTKVYKNILEIIFKQ